MFRSRRTTLIAAAVLLLAACGGGGDSADRQRNAALDVPCTTVAEGSPEPDTGLVRLEFCAEARSYTLIVGDLERSVAGPAGDIFFSTENGATIDPNADGSFVTLVVRSSIADRVAGTLIERVTVAIGDTVTIDKVQDPPLSSSGCITINDNETVPNVAGDSFVVSALLTCEGAGKIELIDGAEKFDSIEVSEGGAVQWTVPKTKERLDYLVSDAAGAGLESGAVLMAGANGAATINADVVQGEGEGGETTTTVEGAPEEETTTTVEGGAEETTTSAAGSSELTLEEKWADCRNAPQVTFDKVEVERTGTLSYKVKWPCLKYMNGERFQQSVWHSFNDRTNNQVAVEGDALKSNVEGDTYTYSSPIGAGAYDIVISVSYYGWDHGWYDAAWFDYFHESFTVATAAASSFDQCSRSDIKVSRGKLSMDCDLTAPLELRLNEDWELLPSENGVVDLAEMKDGWNAGSLKVQSGPVGFYVFGVFCSTKCDVPRESLNVERTIGVDNFWTFKVTRPSWCAEPMIAWLHGYTYKTLGRGVREETDSEMFWEDLEFGLVVDPETSLVRIGDDSYWCSDKFENWQTEAVWADFIVTDDPAETPETTTTVEAPSTTEAPAPTTTVPVGPVADVAPAVLLPRADGSPAEIQVPSNAAGIGVSAASLEAVLAAAKTDVPVVVATFDTGDKVALRRGRDTVMKVPAGAKSVTFTAFKKDGTKVETTATIVTAKPLVKVAIADSSSGGSGFPVLPVGAALVVILLAAGAVVVRRRAVTTGN
ncbi:MAG: hypothetical protein ACKORY_04145 [Actinomycetota bacterium]